MQGVFVSYKRPKTKKELRTADPSDITLEATSIFGNEYDGPLTEAPPGQYYIVGPDPHTKRNWYATITKTDAGVKIT